MKRGGYLGGSTVIGAGSSGWYGTGGPSRKPKAWPKAAKKEAVAAAIARHEQALKHQYFLDLAQALRDAGFTEKVVRRGMALQKAKLQKRRLKKGAP